MKIGDKVHAIDDDFEGVIISKQDNMIDVEGVDGFVLCFRESELIPAISPQDAMRMSQVSQSQILAKETSKTKQKLSLESQKKKNKVPPMEVDLHIGKLVSHHRGMSNFEMLDLQLETAKRQLEFAKNKRIQRIVFIHGVGEGVLKEELHYLLGRYDNLDFYDADYQKYGVGATEVYLYQKGL